jgi:SNF2 family DNA or RNA helicase
LHGYQREGVAWLLANWHASRSSILADEMGLGKTAQVRWSLFMNSTWLLLMGSEPLNTEHVASFHLIPPLFPRPRSFLAP